MAATTSVKAPLSRPTAATAQPSRARRSAAARPIPLVAPVTMAERSVLMMSVLYIIAE